MSFEDLGLDPRLLRALGKRGFTKPTPVQLQAIPRTLEGKDVVARARTGSGKTLAYLLPTLHKILATEGVRGSFRAIILVPTRELCQQVAQEAAATAQHCGADITATALIAEGGPQLRRAVATAGTIVVSTPGKIAAALREGLLPPSALSSRLGVLVLDEADLLLSYGYEEDLQLLAPQIPRSCQCVLMSATVSADVERLTKLVLHNPLTLNLAGGAGEGGAEGAEGAEARDGSGLASGSGVSSSIQHFYIQTPKEDKLLQVMALLRLGLVRKKALIFVNSVDSGVRLRLFLEAFGVRPALLNAELPLNSRSHILASFNKGLFDYLIATDDVYAPSHDAAKGKGGKRGRKGKGGEEGGAAGGGARKDAEFGVTRGIDFKGVRTVVNYDPPSSLQGYVHRVGRTGRAGEAGTAISLFTPGDLGFQEKLAASLGEARRGRRGEAAREPGFRAEGEDEDDSEDEEGAEGSEDGEEEQGRRKGGALRPFGRLSKAQVEALRYRGEDVARGITRAVVKEARAKELKNELLNSERLKEYFEDHAAEKVLLRHDKPLASAPAASHLKHLPAYLKDPSLITQRSETGSGRGHKGQMSAAKKRRLNAGMAKGPSGDPLKAAGTGGSVFLRAPKKGESHLNEELTDMEKRAMEAAKREAKKRKKLEGPAVVPKFNASSCGSPRGSLPGDSSAAGTSSDDSGCEKEHEAPLDCFAFLALHGLELFQQTKILGSGAFGVVSEGTVQLPDGTLYRCARKLYKSTKARPARPAFRAEVAAMQRVQGCPGAVQLLAHSVSPRCCILMELAELGTLQDELELARPHFNDTRMMLPECSIRQIATAVLEVFSVLHSKGVGYFDLKPANVLLQEDRVVQGDLGACSGRSRATGHFPIIGTYGWLAPEVSAAFKDTALAHHITPAADMYSLGLLLANCAAFYRRPTQLYLAPKKGESHLNEELTDMEKRAVEAAKREAKKRRKLEGPAVVPKFNVRKRRR
ncbi:hypothetical protein HYH03_003090 [Edaphochlamys debaryana]|uniref:RNA helicase n=1 Tax=Edaphochlamys debaryana TaxID=47281 RepID=A0A835YBY4_9CHLO|nr:hypothetical protein HYH03_003090 [Edaphochlamys debaryana]|eukprot:KAG2498899.1 hypothetical protein HYH03_003090 [Edaphochlamys debaryana]